MSKKKKKHEVTSELRGLYKWLRKFDITNSHDADQAIRMYSRLHLNFDGSYVEIGNIINKDLDSFLKFREWMYSIYDNIEGSYDKSTKTINHEKRAN